jgi:hypothetical protein
MWDHRSPIVGIRRTPKNPSFSSRKSTSQSVHYHARTRIEQQDQDRGGGEGRRVGRTTSLKCARQKTASLISTVWLGTTSAMAWGRDICGWRRWSRGSGDAIQRTRWIRGWEMTLERRDGRDRP